MDRDNEKDKTKKKSKNNNLILLKSLMEDSNKKDELTEREEELKKRFMDIEVKLKSIEKVLSSVSGEQPDTIFTSEAFQMLVESIAITAAVGAVAEYLEISMDEIDDILK